MPRPISDDEYGDLLATFERSAFRLDSVSHPASAAEAAAFGTFLAGTPVLPSEVGWWKAYLKMVAAQRQQGKVRTRVRVLADPPADYQRWMLWADPWYAEAGEQISYLSRNLAASIGLALSRDWWLLDDERVILLRFADDGGVAGRTLITDARSVARYRIARDLAVRFAVPAAQIAAA